MPAHTDGGGRKSQCSRGSTNSMNRKTVDQDKIDRSTKLAHDKATERLATYQKDHPWQRRIGRIMRPSAIVNTVLMVAATGALTYYRPTWSTGLMLFGSLLLFWARCIRLMGIRPSLFLIGTGSDSDDSRRQAQMTNWFLTYETNSAVGSFLLAAGILAFATLHV